MKIPRILLQQSASNIKRPIPVMPSCNFEPKVLKLPSADEIDTTRKNKLSPGLVTYYKKGLYITQGSMQWLWDNEGKRYLDLFGGIVTVSVGHCHPKVNAALTEQISTLWHTTNIYLHPKIHEYAEKLTATLPEPLKCVHFVNSGSEANDLAMFMARLYTGNYDIFSLRNGYHGMSPYTMGLTAHGTWTFKTPTNFGIQHLMNPDPYKGLFGGSHCRDCPVELDRKCNCDPNGACAAVDLYMDQFEEVVKYSLPKGKTLAGFFAESIQGVGGTVQFPKGYLKKAFARTRELGGICISDEVQTGFGRTGEHFWGFEGHGVVPDMVTMAKGMGNGFPVAAVVTTPEISQVMSQALHFNTFGGNPMSSAVGMAVLDVLKEEKCQENCQNLGTYFIQELGKLQTQHKSIGDVRGKGLMIGVEMVSDKDTKTPLAPEKVVSVWEHCKDFGVLLGKGGLHGNVFRIKPPMCINKEDVDFALQAFKASVEMMENES